MITLKKTDRKDIVKIKCPDCGERLSNVALFRESKIEGLTFKCKKCATAWEIKTE
jgi:predicted RNA-binding Zn-ribbon protein involved in translation (DUF1610 family)